jgi:protein TonB
MTPVRGQAGYALLGTALIHGALLAGLFFGSPPAPRTVVRPPVKIRVVSRPKPPAPIPEPLVAEPPKPEPPKPEPPRPKPARNEAKPESKPTPKPEPMPARAEPPAEPPRPVRRFSVAMEATVSTGGVAVPAAPAGQAFTAGARDGSPDGERVLGLAPVPAPPVSPPPPRALRASEVSRPPRLLTQPSVADMKRLYPETARKDGLEADVSLRILVGTSGEVEEVRLVRGAGSGFDEVAQELVRRFRFEAGTRDGRPVAVWIPWTYKFRLDG